jgi:fatty acid desaturase
MSKKKKQRKMSKKQTSEGRKNKRFIETLALAVTFLTLSAVSISVLISAFDSGYLLSFTNILLGLAALVSSIMFVFFTVALCKTKLIDCYDQIFEPSQLSPFKQMLSAIFVGLLLLAIFIGFIAAAAQIYNETSGGWRLPASILIIIWAFYVLFAMVKNINWKEVIATFRRSN